MGSAIVKFASLTEAEDLIQSMSGKLTITGVPSCIDFGIGKISHPAANQRNRVLASWHQ